MAVDANGSLSSPKQRAVLIELFLALNVRRYQNGTSFSVLRMAQAIDYLCDS